jgi:signal transduction histidine kinase
MHRTTTRPGRERWTAIIIGLVNGSWLRNQAANLPPLLIDGALALALGGVGATQLARGHGPFGDEGRRPPGPGFGGAGRGPAPGGADFLDYLLLGLCAASLVLRRRFPLLSLAGVTAFGAAFLVRGQPVFSVQLIVLVAIYTAIADSTLSRAPALGVAIASAGLLGLAVYFSDAPRSSSFWAMDAAWVLAAIFLGDSVRSRREFAAEAERSREEEGQRRIADERLQIARELHDVVGHSISLINVQAGAGAHVLYKDPDQARDAFETIRAASHDTLQELRSLVGVLREPLAEESLAPTVGLAAVEQLVQSVADAGQAVQLRVTGDRRKATGVVDLSAYRILQEALTNTMRHAPHSRVSVNVDFGDGGISLEITNSAGDNGVTREAGGGHGLTGMRERAAAIGGHLEAGPQPDGGFRVKAVLPLTGSAG